MTFSMLICTRCIFTCGLVAINACTKVSSIHFSLATVMVMKPCKHIFRMSYIAAADVLTRPGLWAICLALDQ